MDTGADAREPGEGLPERIAGYRILRRLGQGSMGVVYEAEQERLARRVALKVLSPVIANDAEAAARFAREAQAAARLDHPRIASVHEMGRDGAFLFYSMELVEGPSLHDWIEATGARRAPAGLDVPRRERWTWLARIRDGVLHAATTLGLGYRIDIATGAVEVEPDETYRASHARMRREDSALPPLAEHLRDLLAEVRVWRRAG